MRPGFDADAKKVPAFRALRAFAGLRGLLVLSVLGLLLFTLVLRFALLKTINIHWDEFNFLRHVHLQARGEQAALLQTFHGHLFSWLVSTGANEIDQILAARRVMFALVLVKTGLLAYLGHRLIGGGAGIFAAFLYGTFAYVQHHGTSFRFDPVVTTLYLGAAALLIARPRPLLTAALAGFLGALALAVSIKSVFFLPPLILITALPYTLPEERAQTVRRSLAFGASGILSTGLLLAWHSTTLKPLVEAPIERAERLANKAILLEQPFPRRAELLATLRWDGPMWLWLLLGFGLIVGGALHTTGRARVKLVSVLSLAFPLCTLYFYRNGWPYYYVTVLPGACLLAGVLWQRAEQLASRRPLLAVLAALVLTVPPARTAWLWYTHNDDDEIAVQRDLVEAVHEIFPEPVPYIDRCGMVASFPKVGPFMTTWTLSEYRARNEDIMPTLLQREQPKLVIDNVAGLSLKRSSVRGSHALRPSDFRTLKENYVHHWGRLWVAGKSLTATAEEKNFEIVIAGTYTLEAKENVEIDGKIVFPGETVTLTQGEHRLRSLGDERVKIVLRIGENLPKPERDPLSGELFRGFKSNKPERKWALFDDDEPADDEGDDERSDDK